MVKGTAVLEATSLKHRVENIMLGLARLNWTGTSNWRNVRRLVVGAPSNIAVNEAPLYVLLGSPTRQKISEHVTEKPPIPHQV